MGPYQSPSDSPEPSSQPNLRNDLFTAVLLPVGAIAGLIFMFALLTTERLIIPGITHEQSGSQVTLLHVRIGSTDTIHQHVWGIGLLSTFGMIGTGVGFLAGKGLGKLTHLGT